MLFLYAVLFSAIACFLPHPAFASDAGLVIPPAMIVTCFGLGILVLALVAMKGRLIPRIAGLAAALVLYNLLYPIIELAVMYAGMAAKDLGFVVVGIGVASGLAGFAVFVNRRLVRWLTAPGADSKTVLRDKMLVHGWQLWTALKKPKNLIGVIAGIVALSLALSYARDLVKVQRNTATQQMMDQFYINDCLEAGKKADAGDAVARYTYGLCLINGEAVPMDINAGVNTLTLSAEQGYVIAQETLAGRCEEQKDYACAMKWYLRAANQDSTYARSRLAELYFDNQAGVKNIAEAYFWGKVRDPSTCLEVFYDAPCYKALKLLTPAEIAEQDKRVAEWKPQMENHLQSNKP